MRRFLRMLVGLPDDVPQSKRNAEWLAQEEQLQMQEVRERLERAEEQLHLIERRKAERPQP